MRLLKHCASHLTGGITPVVALNTQGALMASQFLPLTEYSSKHKVSISTLRRRIKAEDIQYVFEDGKYLILDEPMSTHQRIHRPSLTDRDETLVSAHSSQPLENERGSSAASEEPILSAANRLLTELKKAYTQILQEKEEQIVLLKEEITDLKTLVRVLESQLENR